MVKTIPVVWKGKPLMPTTTKRAYHLVKEGKAMFVKDKHLGCFLKLKKEPETKCVQKLTLGIDPGTCWTGYSVVGQNVETNIEFENTKKLQNKDAIKQQMAERSGYRRMRRARLRHREARFLNRTGHKMSATTNYYVQNITNVVGWIKSLYPIKQVAIEDIAFNHFNDPKKRGKSFSPLEVGKHELYKRLGRCRKVKGWQTFRFRAAHHLFKTKNKSKKDFSAHCVDSYSIARIASGSGQAPNNHCIFIQRVTPLIDRNRRKMCRFKKTQIGKNAKTYKMSKLRKIRTKIDDQQGNHGPWNYQYTKPVPCFHQKRQSYGTSFYLSNNHGHKEGDFKYENYQYYRVA